MSVAPEQDYGLAGETGCTLGWKAGPVSTAPVDLAEMAAAIPPWRFVSEMETARFNGTQYVRMCLACGEDFPISAHPPGAVNFCSQVCVDAIAGLPEFAGEIED